MKKKYLIFPVVAIALAFLAGMIMVVFTTSFVYEFRACRSHDYSDIKQKYDYFDVVNKSGKFAQFVYKIEPNFSNLYVLNNIYSPTIATLYINYAQESNKEELNRLPSDFYEKSAEYSKLYYEFLVDNYEYKEKCTNRSNQIPIPVGGKVQELLIERCNYINALYLNGQKDEARKLVDETIENYDYYNSFAKAIVTFELTDFVFTVHNMETDKEYQKWMLDTERILTQKYNKAVKEEHRVNDFYREYNSDEYFGIYKPFK